MTASSARAASPGAFRGEPRRRRLEHEADLVDVSDSGALQLEEERAVGRRGADVGSRTRAPPRAAHDLDEALGLEDAQRLPHGRPRHLEMGEELGLVRQGSGRSSPRAICARTASAISSAALGTRTGRGATATRTGFGASTRFRLAPIDQIV